MYSREDVVKLLLNKRGVDPFTTGGVSILRQFIINSFHDFLITSFSVWFYLFSKILLYIEWFYISKKSIKMTSQSQKLNEKLYQYWYLNFGQSNNTCAMVWFVRPQLQLGSLIKLHLWSKSLQFPYFVRSLLRLHQIFRGRLNSWNRLKGSSKLKMGLFAPHCNHFTSLPYIEAICI